MTCTREKEIRSVSGTLPDNPGVLAEVINLTCFCSLVWPEHVQNIISCCFGLRN